MAIDCNREWGELSIKHLILETKEYIVFIDSSNDLDWITSKEYDGRGYKDPESYHEILNMVALLDCRPITHLSDINQFNFKRLLGEALARGLSHEYKKAFLIIDQAENFLFERGKELARLWYLRRAGYTSLVIFFIGLSLWLFRGYSAIFLGESGFLIALTMVAGGLGALTSIIFRMGDETFNCFSGKELHELESTYRVIAGMLSALLATLLIRSELLIPAILKMNRIDISLITVGFIAGASERFVPSLLAKIDDPKNIYNNRIAEAEKTDSNKK